MIEIWHPRRLSNALKPLAVRTMVQKQPTAEERQPLGNLTNKLICVCTV